MKDKKGFTLVELIGVIVLIGIIALIAIPSVDYLIKKTKNNAYDRTLDTIIDGLRNWTTDNKELIYEDGTEIILTLADLKEQGYIDFDIKNPKTNACLDNTMEFKIIKVKDENNDKYEFEIIGDKLVDGDEKDCEALVKTPSIYLLGDNPQKIEITNNDTLTYENNYDPGVVATNSNGEDITGRVIKNSNVNLQETSKDYQVRYSIIDNGISKTVIRKVYVVDTTAPELNVPEDLEIYLDETLDLMEGVSATDNSGEEVTIKTSGNVNFNRVGEYKVTYIATDSSGNKTSKERVIKVIKPYYVLQNYYESEDEFHSDLYEKKIVTITFKDNNIVPDDAVVTWDMSEAGNNTIIGYLVKDTESPDYYNMYVGSRGYIRANHNSIHWFRDMTNLMKINFDNFDTTNVVNMSAMFHSDTSLVSLDLSGFDTSKVIRFDMMFYNMKNLSELTVSGFDLSNATHVKEMFAGCSNLENIDVSKWNTSNLKDISLVFSSTGIRTIDVSNWDTSNIETIYGVFSGCQYLESVDVTKWNTSNAKAFGSPYGYGYGGMFQGCSRLKSIDISTWDTSNATSFSKMFYNCTSLESVDLSNFVTSNVQDMSQMFQNTTSMKSIDITNFDTSNVTNMAKMFRDSSAVTEINLSNFNTSKVTDMSEMFWGMKNLKELDLKQFDTSQVTNMSKMFFDTENLENLDITSFDTSNVTNMYWMFRNNEKLKEINLNGFNTSKVTNMDTMFGGCHSLTKLDLSSFTSESLVNINSMFRFMDNITEINLSNMKFEIIEDNNIAFSDIPNETLITVNNQEVKEMIQGLNERLTNIQIAS